MSPEVSVSTALDHSAATANHSQLSPLRFLERSASVFPDRTASIYGDRRYTSPRRPNGSPAY